MVGSGAGNRYTANSGRKGGKAEGLMNLAA